MRESQDTEITQLFSGQALRAFDLVIVFPSFVLVPYVLAARHLVMVKECGRLR